MALLAVFFRFVFVSGTGAMIVWAPLPSKAVVCSVQVIDRPCGNASTLLTVRNWNPSMIAARVVGWIGSFIYFYAIIMSHNLSPQNSSL